MSYKHEDFRADLVWGASGTGKTHQVYLSALQMYVKHRKKTRYLTADGGSLGPIAPLVKLGIVSVFSLGLVPFDRRLEALTIILKGGWPVFDPRLNTWSFKGQGVQPTSKTFEEWGQLSIESMTSIGDQMTRDLVRRSDIKIPQTPDRDEFFVTSGEFKWTFRAPSHIGWSQERMEEFVDMSSVLPYQRILWTARELRSEDKKGNAIIGPELPGSAATGKVPGWFGACLHLVAVPGEQITDDRPNLSMMAKSKFQRLERRLYLIPHPDERTGNMLDAKNRLPAEVQTANDDLKRGYIKSTIVYGPDGKVVNRIGLNTYYDMEDELQDKTVGALTDEFKALGITPPAAAAV